MNTAFTRFDVLIVIVAIIIAGFTAASYLRKSRQAAGVSGCYANLRQIGGAFQTLQEEQKDSPNLLTVSVDATAASIFQGRATGSYEHILQVG